MSETIKLKEGLLEILGDDSIERRVIFGKPMTIESERYPYRINVDHAFLCLVDDLKKLEESSFPYWYQRLSDRSCATVYGRKTITGGLRLLKIDHLYKGRSKFSRKEYQLITEYFTEQNNINGVDA